MTVTRPAGARVQKVQKVQRVQRVVMGAFKNDGRHYDKTFTTALTGGKTSKPGFARGKPYNRALRRAREALIKSLSDFILVFLFNTRNKSTRIASYLRRLMTKY